MADDKKHIGGQAVIEGVMMRNKEVLAIAVRCPKRGIVLRQEVLNSVAQRWKFLRFPVLRGVVAFIEMLVVGTKALMYSANQALEEEEETLTAPQMALTVTFALVAGISLFILLPTVLMRFFQGILTASPLLLNLGEGVLRLSILMLYVLAISRMPDVRRVFQYHGAEHMAVNCFEAGETLDVERVKTFSPLHPRCGTAFLLVVVFISVLLFSFFGWPSLAQRLLMRLALLPLVAGLAYEVIKLAGRVNSPLLYPIIWPGLMMQRLTTGKPDDQQLEVAISALKAALASEEGFGPAAEGCEEPERGQA